MLHTRLILALNFTCCVKHRQSKNPHFPCPFLELYKISYIFSWYWFHEKNSNKNNNALLLSYAPSAPMDTNLTPLLAMKSKALLTLAILWNLILPRSGFWSVSPEMTSSNNINLRPLRKSSSMFSICVPALRKCEFTQAVKVWKVKKIHMNIQKILMLCK